MDETTETPKQTLPPTNHEVGARIGLSHSGVSRIRSGTRLPSVPVMSKIASEYGWDLNDQVEARYHGSYHVEFERVLTRVPETV
jgi:transcriptional regulator with XRE-family HTH domain